MLNCARPERIEPTNLQKLNISKTAIETVIQNPIWQKEKLNVRSDLNLFGQYIAVQLNEINNEEQLINIQQKILSLLNKS